MYEVGDKVIYQGADKSAYKREGTVKSIEDKDGTPQLAVELDGGETFTAPIDDWSREFTNAARNGIHQGSRVKYVGDDPRWKGMTGVVLRVNDNSIDGRENYYWVDFPGRPSLPESELVDNAATHVSTNSVVRNAIAANRRVARNSVEVEISLMYAGRVQHAMRDAARSVSGVRISGTNTLYCPDEDAADEVVYILEQAGVPKREISLNAKRRVARNVRAGDREATLSELESATKELESMVAKATPWRTEMKRMRRRADGELSDYWISRNNPEFQKLAPAYQRYEKAKAAVSDLWWSI